MSDQLDDLFEPEATAPEAELPPYDSESFKAKKQKERDDTYSLLYSTAERMQQDAPLFQQHLDVQARFHRYSANNCVLITAQRPDATRLAAFEEWNTEGIFVSKGEKALSILEPSKYTREDGTPGTAYNVKKVFDIGQTNAEPVEQKVVTRDERELLRALMTDAPCKLKISNNMSERVNAAYRPEDKIIFVRPGMDGATIFRSVSQELAHAHMDGKDYSRAEKTPCAYFASYILCKRFGVPTDQYRFDTMPEQYRSMDAKAFRKELSSIREVANTISRSMYQVLEPAKREQHKRGGDAR